MIIKGFVKSFFLSRKIISLMCADNLPEHRGVLWQEKPGPIDLSFLIVSRL